MQSAVPQPHEPGLFGQKVLGNSGLLRQELHNAAASRTPLPPSQTATGAARAMTCEPACTEPSPEGHEASVARLWDSIRLDARHRVVWATPPSVVTTRTFPGSPSTLAMMTDGLARLDPVLVDEVLPLPASRHPSCLSTLADRLCDAGRSRAGDPIGRAVRAVLRPKDAAGQVRPDSSSARQDRMLVEVMTGADCNLARRCLDAALARCDVPDVAVLAQGVLDGLQTAWMDGEITALQSQIAVAMLQAALRLRLDLAEHPQTIGCALVCLLPGTAEMCGVMVKVALLRRAGWSVRLILPQTPEAILESAQELGPDLIVLAGSRLVCRQAERAMLAALLPALALRITAPVMVGGKLAEADPQAVLALGADAVCGALVWTATIAAHLTDMPVNPALSAAQACAAPSRLR